MEELFEAAAWYRDRQPGLELEFLAEVDRILPLLEASPASFPRVPFGLTPKVGRPR